MKTQQQPPRHSYNLRKGLSAIPYKRLQIDQGTYIKLSFPVEIPEKPAKKPLENVSISEVTDKKRVKYSNKQKPAKVQQKPEKTPQIPAEKTLQKPEETQQKAQRKPQENFANFHFVTDPATRESFSKLASISQKTALFSQDVEQKFSSPTISLENADFFDISQLSFSKFPLLPPNPFEISPAEEAEEIEIVDNMNKKIKIKVSGLSGKTSLRSFEKIPNPIDFSSRQQWFSSQTFANDFKSGYAPIEIQKTQEKDFSQAQSKEKAHFIRKKQSCAAINLKRTCGVSYIKPSESQQLNVSEIFPRLPPLVYQCSSECGEIADISEFEAEFLRVFAPGKLLICSVFEAEDEELREYLQFPQKRPGICRGRVVVARSYKDLWPLFVDKFFIIVHLFQDAEKVVVNWEESAEKLRNPAVLDEILTKSRLQLVIQLKKNLSGKKSYVKTLGTEFNRFLEEKSEDLQDFNENSEILDAACLEKPLKSEKPKEKTHFLTNLMRKLQDFFAKKSPSSSELMEQETNSAVTTRTFEAIANESRCTTAKTSPNKGVCPRNVFGVHPSIVNYLQKEPKMKNIYTCSVRMELYLEENLWKSLDSPRKNRLNGLILFTEDAFQREALQMSNQRIATFESNCAKTAENALESLMFCDSQGLRALKFEDLFGKCAENRKFKEISSFALPLYFISTRDCFAFDLVERKTVLQLPGRPNVLKTEYFFHPKAKPQNFKCFEKEFPDCRVGVTSYTNFFTHEELKMLEDKTFETEIKCFKKHFLPMTAQATFTSEKVRRTKFFFGYRYMWSKQQIAEPFSNIAAGVRSDVSPPPDWLKQNIEGELVAGGIIPKGFVNSITMNVYHDGKEGLAQHFDDAVRFKQPIYSVRLFSDCRLSFGSQFYGFCNGAFCIPLPRGCIAVLEENSYAANGIKHCVRPCDMTGKSAAIILRQMHEKCLVDSRKLDEFVDFPAWMSTLSLDEQAVSYDEQKRIEAEMNLLGKGCNSAQN